MTTTFLTHLTDFLLADSKRESVRNLIKAALDDDLLPDKSWEQLFIEALHAGVEQMRPRQPARQRRVLVPCIAHQHRPVYSLRQQL